MKTALAYPKGTGLNATPRDQRDFPLGGVAGFANIGTLPKSFTVSIPMVIKDQGYGTDCCTGEALTAVAEDQDDVIFDPLYTYARTKMISGDPEGNIWGADLRSACKSAVQYGFKPTSMALAEKQITTDDVRLALNPNANIYDIDDDKEAATYKKKSFFTVGGPCGIFDQMRSALWQTRDEERSIFTGIEWNTSWNESPNGVVDSIIDGQKFGHAVKAFGWDNDYLLLQLSNGKQIGKGGVFTIHKDIINIACKYGGFTFLDMPREVAEYQLKRIGFFRYLIKSISS